MSQSQPRKKSIPDTVNFDVWSKVRGHSWHDTPVGQYYIDGLGFVWYRQHSQAVRIYEADIIRQVTALHQRIINKDNETYGAY